MFSQVYSRWRAMNVPGARSQSIPRRRGPLGRGLVFAVLALLLAVAFAMPEEPREELSRTVETDQVKAAQLAASRGGEVLHLRWKLSGFLGALAGLFVPNNGDGVRMGGNGRESNPAHPAQPDHTDPER